VQDIDFLNICKDSGDLYTFGWNHLGRLGFPLGKDSAANCAEPSLIEFCSENDEELNVLKVACGSAHTVVITGKERNEQN
jgi:alpha-tubulin suppressor-like RCC1 family protein